MKHPSNAAKDIRLYRRLKEGDGCLIEDEEGK